MTHMVLGELFISFIFPKVFKQIF